MLQGGWQAFPEKLSVIFPFILSFLIKVIHVQRLLNKTTWTHLDHHKLVSEKQFGFRAGNSTSDALTYIAQCPTNIIDDREEAQVVCLDFSKAFNRVWHSSLFVKLQVPGFACKLLDWLIKSFPQWHVFESEIHQCRRFTRLNSWPPVIHHFHRWYNPGLFQFFYLLRWWCHSHGLR